MADGVRSRRVLELEAAGRRYSVEAIERPFREGVELCVELPPELGGERLVVSDRGLGEHEALRLLAEAIERRQTKGAVS